MFLLLLLLLFTFLLLRTLVAIVAIILMVGDFNIHMDNGNNSLTIAFQSLIDWVFPTCKPANSLLQPHNWPCLWLTNWPLYSSASKYCPFRSSPNHTTSLLKPLFIWQDYNRIHVKTTGHTCLSSYFRRWMWHQHIPTSYRHSNRWCHKCALLNPWHCCTNEKENKKTEKTRHMIHLPDSCT